MHSDQAAAGRRARADRALRVSRIRRRIAATAVGAFALVWGLIAAKRVDGLADRRDDDRIDQPGDRDGGVGDVAVLGGRAAPAVTTGQS